MNTQEQQLDNTTSQPQDLGADGVLERLRTFLADPHQWSYDLRRPEAAALLRLADSSLERLAQLVVADLRKQQVGKPKAEPVPHQGDHCIGPKLYQAIAILAENLSDKRMGIAARRAWAAKLNTLLNEDCCKVDLEVAQSLVSIYTPALA